MRIIIYGAQGSGKSTQAEILAKKLNLPLLSTGEISREIATQDTPEGKQMKEIVNRGDPAPSEIINPIIAAKLNSPQAVNGFILDGFPRYNDQFEFLEKYFQQTNRKIDKVIVLQISQAESLKRLLARAKTEGRQDDTPESIAHRLDLYHQETEPIIDHYRKQNIVFDVDGSGTVEEIASQIIAVVQK